MADPAELIANYRAAIYADAEIANIEFPKLKHMQRVKAQEEAAYSALLAALSPAPTAPEAGR